MPDMLMPDMLMKVHADASPKHAGRSPIESGSVPAGGDLSCALFGARLVRVVYHSEHGEDVEAGRVGGKVGRA